MKQIKGKIKTNVFQTIVADKETIENVFQTIVAYIIVICVAVIFIALAIKSVRWVM
jgi:hypothetical protein